MGLYGIDKMEIRLPPKLKSLLLLFLILFICTVPNVFAYRPFIFTDAAVAALKEWEIEVGLFSMTHDRGINEIFVPSLKFNYGILKNWELVGEFDLQVFKQGEDRNRELTDPAFFIKGVLREGILQDKKGISFVVELGVLLPSTVEGERKAGLEGIVVITGKLSDLVFHINLGGEFDRDRFALHGRWDIQVMRTLRQTLTAFGAKKTGCGLLQSLIKLEI